MVSFTLKRCLKNNYLCLFPVCCFLEDCMKIVFVENSTLSATKFRLSFLKALVQDRHTVTVICGDDRFSNNLKDAGVEVISGCHLNNRSVSVIKDFRYLRFLKEQIQNIRPDVVFTYQLKPNIYGCIAAKRSGVRKIFSTVEGVGDPFIKQGLKWSIIRLFVTFLLRFAFSKINKVVFLNKDNERLFLERRICKENQATIIDGVGVDSNKFSFAKISRFNHVVMVARLLKSKGVLEFCEAASWVKNHRPDLNLVFELFGEEKELSASDLREFVEDGDIIYHGFCNAIADVYKNAGMVVLPSYGEGMPMSLMEAMSVGRPIIATDIPGCREVVKDGWNGFLVPPRNSVLLAEAIIKLAESKETMTLFGEHSRILVEERFSSNVINEKFLALLS